MRCLNPTRNTFEFTSNIGGNQTFEFFKNSRYTNLPAFKVYANNNTIVYSQAALENIIQKFLPKNVFAVQHLNNLVDKLPVGAKAAFFKDVLYFGENVSKEEIAEETFHAIFQRLLPANIKAKYLEEGKSLVENIEKQMVELKTAQPTIYGSLTKEEAKERIIEETIAKAYVDYFVKNTTPTNKKNDVLSLLHNFFKWLKNIFFSAKQNQSELEILFEDVLKGNFTKSTIQNENESSVPTLRLVEYTGVDETGNPVRKNLSNKESDMMVASIASIVIELDEKLTREQKEQLDLRTRSKRITKAIEELRRHYLKNGDEFKASALEEYSEEAVNMETGEEEEFVSPSLQNLKEDVAKYLNVVTGKSIKEEEDNNENDEAELQGGDTIAANEKGFDQLSAWIRNYISTTGRFVDSFQIEGISTPINIYEVVDKGKIYYSLARAMQNSTTEIERLYKLVEIANLGTNKDTRLLVQRVAKDVLKNPEGLEDEELFQAFRENVKNLYETWKGNKKENRLIINDIKNLDVQKQFILQTLLQGFNLWNRDNYQVNVSFKKEYKEETGNNEDSFKITTKVHQANQHSASEVQLQMWENYFLNVRDGLTESEIKYLISNITSASPTDLEDNLTKAFTILFGGVDSTYINYLITPTSDNSIGGTYTAEGTIEDVVAMLNIVVEDLKKQESILFDNDQGAVSRLTKFAKNTSKVNEDVIEATYKDAENKTRYSYQNKTFQLFMFNEFLNSNHIEEYKSKITSNTLYEYSEGKYLEQASRFLYDGKNKDRTSLNHILFLDTKDGLDIDATKWQEALSNGAYYSMDGLTTDSGATTFGGMENRDFFLYKLHLMSNRTSTSQPIHINLMEAKRTTSFKEVMLLEGLYNDSGITKKGTELFANEIIKEIKRMHDEKSKVKNWLQLILSKGVPENKIVELTRESVIKASTVSDAEGVIEKYHTGNYKVVLDENNNIVDFFVDAKGARAFNFTDNLKGILTPANFARLKELYFNVPDSFDVVYSKIKANDKFYETVKKSLTDYLNIHQVEVEKLKGLLPVSKRYGDLNSTPFVQQQSNFKNDVLSQWINTIWVNQLINSDSALLVKNDGADFVKRAGGQNAAIQSLVTSFLPPPEYSITKKDDLSKTRYVVGTDPKGIVSFKPKKENGKTNDVDSADAQSYNTVHAYRKYLYGIGKLSNEIAQLLNKVELGVPFTSLDMEVMKEKDVYFNVLKPVGYDGYFYFKTGTLMLGRELTSHWVGETDRNTLFEEGRFAELNLESNWVAKAGREPLHNLRTAMEENNVDYYLGQTASKQLTINKFSKDFKTLPDTLKGDEEFQSSINVMDTNFFGQQMENPSGKTSVIDPSQMLEIILNEQNEKVFVRINGVEVEIKQALKDWVRLSKNRDNLKFTEALNEIANDDFTINYNRFLDKAKETLISSGAEDQLIEFFSKDDKGNPNYNLNMSVTVDKFVNLLTSHFTKGVLQQKVAGDSLALVSSEGLKGIKKLIKYKAEVGDEYKDVYSWEWLNEDSAEYDSILRSNSYHTITDVEYSEFDTNDQITGSLSPLNQTLKDLYEGDGQVRYVVDELRFGVPVWKTTGEMVDGIPVVHVTPEYYASESLYPSYEKGVKNTKELQGSFGVRIPSQDKHSATNTIWSGMLPSYYGNTISVAKEIEYLSGSDFDIDKLFLHRKEIYKNENGDWVVWSMKDHTFAKYVNYHAKNNKTVKRYLKTLLQKDSRYVAFLKEIDNARLEHIALKKEVSNEYSSDEIYRKSLNIKTLEDEIHKIDLELERLSFTPEVLQYSFVSETVEKLQLDKTFLQEGIEWKKELKERLGNDYYKNKLQGIRDRIHSLNEGLNKVIEFHLYPIFKDLKLIQTKEEFDRRAGDGEVLIHPIINNQLLELKQRFLTNQETLKRGEKEAIALTPATQDNLKEFLAKSFVNVNGVSTMLFKDVVGKNTDGTPKLKERFSTDMRWSTHSQLGQLQAHRNVVTGKRNIGSAVVANLMHLFAKKSERSLLSPIQLYDVDKNNNLILNTLFSFKNAINERGNRIADILSELVSAATDETKDQQNAKYNLSMEALNIVTPMLMLGASLESAILLVNHPDVQKYLQLVGKKGLILKTQKEITESQRTNEDVLQDLMLNKESLGTPSILHFKDGRNGYEILNLVSKMLQISKEVGAANYIISLKKGLGKDLDSFEAGEAKIDSTTKEEVPKKALTNIATVFAEDNPMLEQYQNQIEIHDKIARLFDTNLIRRNSTYKELYSIFKANFKTSSYDKFVKWMNDSVLGFVYSKAYFDSLTDNKEKYTQYTNEALENTEKKWWDFVQDLKNVGGDISDEKKKDLLENLFVKKIRKGKKNSEIRIPTFVKSDVSTSSTLTDAFLDMNIKLIGTKWESLPKELFHYFVHKDAWVFKGGSLSKGIHPLFFKDHSRSLDEAVKNKQFLNGSPTGLLAYLAIEKATNTLEGSKEIKRVNQKNSSFLSPILSGTGFSSKNLFKLEETQIQSLIENGYMELKDGKFKVLTPPLYHKFSVQVVEGVYDTKTMKLETVTIAVGGKQYILNAKDYFANRDKIYKVVGATYTETVTGNEKSLSLPLTQRDLDYTNYNVFSKLGMIGDVEVEFLRGEKIISNEDVTNFNKFNSPKEFFTPKTLFKQFYNVETGKRETAPSSSKWILNPNSLYDLVDLENGEQLISNVDLSTGYQMIEISKTEESASADSLVGKTVKVKDGKGFLIGKVLGISAFKIGNEETYELEDPTATQGVVLFNPSDVIERSVLNSGENIVETEIEKLKTIVFPVVDSKANLKEILNTSFVNDKGFAVLPNVGIMVKQNALSIDEIQYFLDLIKSVEDESFYANVGKDANVMLVPEGKMWTQRQHFNVGGIYEGKTPTPSKNTKVETNSAYSYYDTTIDGDTLKPVSQKTIDILSKVFGDNLNNIIDATIGNIYFRNTGIGQHKDTTEPNNNIGVYGVVLGNPYDLIVTTEAVNDPKYGAGAGTEIAIMMKQGTAYKFGINDEKGNIQGRFLGHRPVGNPNTEIDNELLVNLPILNLPEVKKARYKQSSTVIPATTKNNYGLSITYRSVVEKKDIPKEQIQSDLVKLNVPLSLNSGENSLTSQNQPLTTMNIYSQLGNKTQSENVVLPQDLGGKAKDIFGVMSEFKKENPKGIIAYRVNNSKPLVQNLKEQNAIGNPFDWNKYGVGKATNMFIDWVLTKTNYGEALATDEYHEAVIAKIKSSKKENILYYDEFNAPTHATALDFLINKYNWNTKNTNLEQKDNWTSESNTSKKAIRDVYEKTFKQPSTNIEQQQLKTIKELQNNPNFKPLNIEGRSGGAVKDTAKMKIGNKLISFGEKGSSTWYYQQDAKENHNPPSYSSNDVVNISVNGNSRPNQRENVEKTKQVILKAIQQGVNYFVADEMNYAKRGFNSNGEGEIARWFMEDVNSKIANVEYQPALNNQAGIYKVVLKQQPNLNQQGSKDSVKKDFIRVKGYFITTNYENGYDGSFINYRVYNNNNEYFFNYHENSRVSVPNEISWHLNQKGINISRDDVKEMFKNIDKNNDIYKELEESKKLNQPLPPKPNQSTEEGTDATCPIS